MLCQRPRGFIGGFKFVQEILSHSFPVAAFDHLTLVPEIIQDIRWVSPQLIDLGVAAFMLCGDIGDMIRQLDQLISTIIRLSHDAFLGFCEVMFETQDILETQRSEEGRVGKE